jgi:hypothetical protein
MSNLVSEFNFYRANQDDMLAKYAGKVIVIKNREILGEYDTHLAAFSETIKHHERGTFIVQQVSEGNEAYIATFHSPGIIVG